MLYQLIDETRYLQGLPIQKELDDSILNDDELKLLEQAVAIGIYAPATKPKTIASSKKKDSFEANEDV